jgi:hypothetical protein
MINVCSLRAFVLYFRMARILWIAFLFFFLLVHDSRAQLRIEKLHSKDTSIGFPSLTDDQTSNIDTLFIGSINTNSWKSYTKKFGKDIEFGLILTLPDPGHPYKLISFNLPFYGGGYQSGGLRESGLSSRVWGDLNAITDIVEDSILEKTSSKSYKIGAFEYRIAELTYSSMPFFEGPKSLGISVLYESGPDSSAISPIWTEDKMIHQMFYSRKVPLTDSTSERRYFSHDDFWKAYNVDGSSFGQLSGYLLIEIDTSRARRNPDDSEGPIGTGLNEKWFLPGSHRVIENFPNPFNPTTTLRIMPQLTGEHEIIVYDISGRLMYKNNVIARLGNEFTVHISGDRWASGVYFVSVRSATYRWIHPISLIK